MSIVIDQERIGWEISITLVEFHLAVEEKMK